MQINSNISGMQNNNSLRLHGLDFKTRIERLSSGLRINKGADDPSGLAISKGMTAQIRGTNVAIQNCQDGINLIQTMDAGLNEIQDILLRMRALSVRAANEATLTIADRAKMQDELDTLRDEIDQISGRVTYNGRHILQGSTLESFLYSVGFVWSSGGTAYLSQANDNGNNKVDILIGTLSGSYGQVVWSNDFQKLLYTSAWDIFCGNANGTAINNLTSSTAHDAYGSWSSDNSKIYFASDTALISTDIYVIDEDGNNLTNLTNSPASWDSLPKVSRFNDKIAYLHYIPATGDYGIWIMDSDGANKCEVINGPINFSSINMFDISPDGTKIAFTAKTAANNFVDNIYQVNSDGTNLTQLTMNSSPLDGNSFTPKYSPDGSKIMYGKYGGPFGGAGEIFIMDADGSNKINVTNNNYNETIWLGGMGDDRAWSPNGDKILFTSERNGSFDVFVVNIDGTNEIAIADSPANEVAVGWAPPYDSNAYNVLQVDSNSGSESRLNITFANAKSSTLGITGLSVKSASSAQSAIDTIDTALDTISNERADKGIIQNRIGHIINDLSAQAINTSAARSRIEDADMAVEATELAKRQILLNSTQSISSQANIEQQAALDLVMESVQAAGAGVPANLT